jgi:multidrug efflux pump subunit AcrA (membrane-fusion protein)
MRIAALMASLMVLSTVPAASEDWVVESATKETLLRGYTRAETAIDVSAEVSGKVLRVNYEVGQIVAAEPICEIDPTFVDFQIESSRHALAKLSLALDKSRSLTDYLQKEFSRIDRLYQEKSTAETQRDKAAEDLNQARLDTATIEMQIAEMKTALSELREKRRRHRVYGPRGWRVTAKHVEVGEIVGVGTPLVRVADFRRLVVPLSVSGGELNALRRLPQAFEARLENASVRASLNWVNPEFDEATRKLSIELILHDVRGDHRGGLVFSMPLEIAADGLRVPQAAVNSRYDNPRVKLAATGETVQVIIIGETATHFIIAENRRLSPGTRLTAAP